MKECQTALTICCRITLSAKLQIWSKGQAIIVKKTMSNKLVQKNSQATVRSRFVDKIAIKRTNAQISGMEHFKWDTSN